VKTINVYYLHQVFGPLNGMTDSEFETAQDNWDPSSPRRYHEFLARELLPSYAVWDAASQTNVLDALQYALATGRVDFAAVLADQWYSPMPTPDDPREVFEALWELFAPGHSYLADDVATWQEHNVRAEAVIRERRANLTSR
jgi:hypothetical protein